MVTMHGIARGGDAHCIEMTAAEWDEVRGSVEAMDSEWGLACEGEPVTDELSGRMEGPGPEIAAAFNGAGARVQCPMPETEDPAGCRALVVARMARYGQAAGLRALVESGASFRVLAHEGEDGRIESLITEALRGWGTTLWLAGGGEADCTRALLEVYADTVEALLDGDAAQYIVCTVPLLDSWPLVKRIWERCGVKIIGWAPSEYEERCWDSAMKVGANRKMMAAVYG